MYKLRQEAQLNLAWADRTAYIQTLTFEFR